MFIVIDGEKCEVEIENEAENGVALVCEGRREWYLAKDSDAAGAYARKYWADMADNDADEFASIIGTQRLVFWATGRSDEYGFRSLEDFLDGVERVPEEELAGYDGEERTVDRIGKLAKELGWEQAARKGTILAYRHN